jgi:hypothetical protein
MKKPNFFIIGAPKCGTNSVCEYLRTHPNVFMSPATEPHHFYQPHQNSGHYAQLESYENLFTAAGPDHIAVGEASSGYLLSRIAVPRILAYQPEAKFIVCIRNPADMAVSLHNMCVTHGYEKILSFESAWRLNDEREAGSKIGLPAYCTNPRYTAYRYACSAGSQLADVKSLVPDSRVHVVVLDDLIGNPRCEYLKLLHFLGVEDDGKTDFPAMNTATNLRMPAIMIALRLIASAKYRLGIRGSTGSLVWLHKLNRGPKGYSTPSTEMRHELIRAFNPEVRKLERILGRDLSAWRVG